VIHYQGRKYVIINFYSLEDFHNRRNYMKCDNGHYFSGRYCKICGVKPQKKKPEPIAKRSKKRAKQERDYEKVRDAYLTVFPICEVHNCGMKSKDVHHKRGRIGSLLTDINYFMAVCRKCHSYIELHPEWAKIQGYSESRLTN
jgi:hypothetical protein